MTVTPQDVSDLRTLRVKIAAEPEAKQRDRYRAVLLAAKEDPSGVEFERDQIAFRLGRSPRFIDQRLGRYRRDGPPGLEPTRATGRPPKIDAAKQQMFKARLLAGRTVSRAGVRLHEDPRLEQSGVQGLRRAVRRRGPGMEQPG